MLIFSSEKYDMEEYYHDCHCNISRSKPMGDAGCSCFMFKRARKAEIELKEANELLRSAFAIAERNGASTNWEAWRNQLRIALNRQHKILYPVNEKALV
jgi:hypothetical protein